VFDVIVSEINLIFVGYRTGSLSAQVSLESFMDLLCPDSKQSWPVLQQGPSIKLFII
jgi:hypothetical protein